MSAYSIDYFFVLRRDDDLINFTYNENFKNVQSWKVLVSGLKFQAKIVNKYPELDHSHINSPERSICQFVFPLGLNLKYSSNRRFPIPSFFTFVFTDEKGKYFYVACLQFYEVLKSDEVQKVVNHVEKLSNMTIIIPENVTFFSPKVICVLSTYPFYRTMRAYLSQLYSMSLSEMSYPLEYFITCLVGKLPLPIPGGRCLHYIQDIALIHKNSRSLTPLVFSLPSSILSYPFLDLDFSAPLRCLNITNFLIIFILLLHESKIIFICQSNNMLTEVMETYRYLLFPLTWATTYVSRLPNTLLGMFEALGGFLIGLTLNENPCTDVEFDCNTYSNSNSNSNTNNSNSNSNKSNIHTKPIYSSHSQKNTHNSTSINNTNKLDHKQYPWIKHLAVGTYVVDLTNNEIYYTYNNNHDDIDTDNGEDDDDDESRVIVEALTDSFKTELLDSLPRQSYLRILDRLTTICQKYSIGPQKINSSYEQFDSAYAFHNPYDDPSAPLLKPFPTLAIRDLFCILMTEILSHYQKFIILPERMTGTSNATDTFRTFHEIFDINGYIRYNLLLQTQNNLQNNNRNRYQMSSSSSNSIMLSNMMVANSNTNINNNNDNNDDILLNKHVMYPLIYQLTHSHMFSYFIQQRIEGTDPGIIFFENISKILNDLHITNGKGDHDNDNQPSFFKKYVFTSSQDKVPPRLPSAIEHLSTILAEYRSDMAILNITQNCVQNNTINNSNHNNIQQQQNTKNDIEFNNLRQQYIIENKLSNNNTNINTSSTHSVITYSPIQLSANALENNNFEALKKYASEFELEYIKSRNNEKTIQNNALKVDLINNNNNKNTNTNPIPLHHFYEIDQIQHMKNSKHELKLNDSNTEPLILPGPLPVGIRNEIITEIIMNKNNSSNEPIGLEILSPRSVELQNKLIIFDCKKVKNANYVKLVYDSTWPQLKSILFKEGLETALHPNIDYLASLRSNHIKKSQSIVCDILRNYHESYPFFSRAITPIFNNTSIVANRDTNVNTIEINNDTSVTSSVHGFTVPVTPLQLPCHIEWNVIATVYLDIMSISMLMLSARTLALLSSPSSNSTTTTTATSTTIQKSSKKSNCIHNENYSSTPNIQILPSINSLLQIIGLLSEIEDKGLLAYVDEPIWRGLFLLCNICENEQFCKEIAWTLYDTMIRFNIPINALTYGAFMKVVHRKCTSTSSSDNNQYNSPSLKSSIMKNSSSTKNMTSTTKSGLVIENTKENLDTYLQTGLDTYLHLEEMGLTWLIQRSAIEKHQQFIQNNNNDDGNDKKLNVNSNNNNINNKSSMLKSSSSSVAATSTSTSTWRLSSSIFSNSKTSSNQIIKNISTVPITTSTSTTTSSNSNTNIKQSKSIIHTVLSTTATQFTANDMLLKPLILDGDISLYVPSQFITLSSPIHSNDVFDHSNSNCNSNSNNTETTESVHKNSNLQTEMYDEIDESKNNDKTDKITKKLIKNLKQRIQTKLTFNDNNNDEDNEDRLSSFFSPHTMSSSLSNKQFDNTTNIITDNNNNNINNNSRSSINSSSDSKTDKITKMVKNNLSSMLTSFSTSTNAIKNHSHTLKTSMSKSLSLRRMNISQSLGLKETSFSTNISNKGTINDAVIVDQNNNNLNEHKIENNNDNDNKTISTTTENVSINPSIVTNNDTNNNSISKSELFTTPVKSKHILENLQSSPSSSSSAVATKAVDVSILAEDFNQFDNDNTPSTPNPAPETPLSAWKTWSYVDNGDDHNNSNSNINNNDHIGFDILTPITETSNSSNINSNTNIPATPTSPISIAKSIRNISNINYENNVVQLQIQIQKIVKDYCMYEKKAIGIYSRMECSHCHHTMLDDEILTELIFKGTMYDWGRPINNNTHTTMNNITEKTFHCIFCKKKFDTLPQLHIRIYSQQQQKQQQQLQQNNNNSKMVHLSYQKQKLNTIWSIDVEYMSPKLLRYQLETYIKNNGSDYITLASYMQNDCPDIYWNILWYSARIGTPTGFSPEMSDIHNSIKNTNNHNENDTELIYDIKSMPIIIGWREDIVIKKVKLLLNAMSNNSNHGNTSIMNTKQQNDNIKDNISNTPTPLSMTLEANEMTQYMSLSQQDIFPHINLDTWSMICEVANIYNGTSTSLLKAMYLFRYHGYQPLKRFFQKICGNYHYQEKRQNSLNGQNFENGQNFTHDDDNEDDYENLSLVELIPNQLKNSKSSRNSNNYDNDNEEEDEDEHNHDNETEMTTMTARELFIGLLYVIHYFKKHRMIITKPTVNANTTVTSITLTQSHTINNNNENNSNQTEIIYFCPLFLHTVTYYMKSDDFINLNTTKQELINAISSQAVQITRLSFGLLY